MQITPGTLIRAQTALGESLIRVAATGIVPGIDFPVVWVCEAQEWAIAQSERREPDAVPWPADAVCARHR